MKDFGLPKGLLNAVGQVLKSDKTSDVNLQEKIRRDNTITEKQDSFASVYASVAADGRKQEAERQAQYAEGVRKAHMRMGKSIVEQTEPKTSREKALAAKKPPKDKITHADVLAARGVKLEEYGITDEMLQTLANISIPFGTTKRMSVPLGEQRNVISSMTRTLMLSFDKIIDEHVELVKREDPAFIKAITEAKLAITNELLNSINIGSAVSKVNEAKKIKKFVDNAFAKEVIKSRQSKIQGDVSDETIRDGDAIDEASYSAKAAAAGKDIGKPGKQFASIAKKAAEKYGSEEAGQRVAGAVLKKLRSEGFAEMDAWLKKKKAEEGTGKFEKKKISTGTVYTKKPEKEKKVDEAMQKSDVPAYLRKQKGEKPLTVADVKGPRKDSISSKEGLAKLRNEEAVNERITIDKDGNKIGGGSVGDLVKDKDWKNKFKPSEHKTNPFKDMAYTKKPQSTVPPGAVTKEEVEIEEATHVFSGFSKFMKKHASKLRDAGLKVKKVVHDPDSGTSEYHVTGPKAAAHAAGKEYEKADKGQHYGGRISESMRPGFDWEAAAKRTDDMKKRGYERGDAPYTWKKIKPTDKPADKKETKKETKEEVTLSAEELARINELAKQFDSKE